LIVRNEETMLPGCLDALAGVVDRLAVVDTGSHDRTTSLLEAESRRDRFETVAWEQHALTDFADARNRALVLVGTPWCLWIDADERLSAGLRAELRRIARDGTIDDADAWSLPFRVHVLGRAMTCRELSDQRHVRLFRTAGAAFAGAVHEGLALPEGARIGGLSGVVDHRTMTSWRTYWRKVRRYTQLESGSRSRLYALGHLPIALMAGMWRLYVWRGCWRDGWPGFVWAGTSAMGSALRDLRIITRRRRPSSDRQGPI